MTVVLCADSITKSYTAERRVLTAATLRAVAGSVTYLVGLNGCGKSTLLQVASGALTADNGTVSYKGRSYLRPRWPVLARHGLYYLPDRELLSPTRTIRQHLEIIDRKWHLAGYAAAVRICELEPLLDQPCVELSTGERRRAEVATAFARQPDCLLADEPYRNLDPQDGEIVAVALAEMASNGCAVVVTGHEVEQLMWHVDSVLWCTDGTTYELGPPEEALTHWRFVQKYIGEGRAERMLAERRERDVAT